MTIYWGAAKNGFKIGVEVAPFPTITSSTTSVAVGATCYLYCPKACNDNNNDLTWTGGMVLNGADSDYSLVAAAGATLTLQHTNGEAQPVNWPTAAAPFGVQASVTFLLHNFGNAGGDLTVTRAITYPLRPWILPTPPPSVGVVRSGGSHVISWTPQGIAGSRPWSVVNLERWDSKLQTWSGLQTWSITNNITGEPGATVTTSSFADASLSNDRIYNYRVRASNSTGSSAYTYSPYISTTPLPPTNVVATRNGLNVNLAWVNNSTINTGFTIQRYEDGVLAATVTTAATATGYVFVSLNSTKVHSFKIWANAANSMVSLTVTSNSVTALTNPVAPTNLLPAGGWFDKNFAKVFTWTHNSVDTTPQTAFEVRYRSTGVTTWTTTGKITSTASSWTAAANLFVTNNLNFEWQVRTWGLYSTSPDYSPWSDSSTFGTSLTPTVSITTPTAGDYNTSTLPLGWTFTAGNAPQARFVVTLTAAGQEVFRADVNSAATTYTPAFVLKNSTTYLITLTVYDSRGLSAVATRTIDTVFTLPMTPTVTVLWDPDEGSAQINITNPTPVFPKVAAVFNRVYRRINDGDWVLIADNASPGTTVTDYIPVTGVGLNEYVVQAVSATPTTADSLITPLVIECPKCGQYFWFNYGDDFSTFTRVRGNPDLKVTYGRDKTLRWYAGRPKPVFYVGEARQRKLSLSAVLEGGTHEDEAAFTDLNDTSDVVCYRDAWGRRLFVTVGDIDFTQMQSTFLGMSTDMTEVDYVEGL